MFETMISFSDTAAATASNSSGNGMSVWENLGLGGSVMLLGLTIVFTGLVTLILITWAYPKIVRAILPRSAAAKEKRAIKKAERLLARQKQKDLGMKTDIQAVSMSAVPAAEANDTALIAVITAAIAASLGTSTNGIVIKSLRRSRTSLPAWGTSARSEQISNRL